MHSEHGMPGGGLVMHRAARYYDELAWLITLGREGQLRTRILDIARLQPGDVVLDVGCGTGTLALAARTRVGASGEVHGIDASEEMIAVARSKARGAHVDIDFKMARAEQLPFGDATFDVVLSTLMMHHLNRSVREALSAEIERVLKPDGRALVVDFERQSDSRGLMARLHKRGHVPLAQIVELLRGARLQVSEVGAVGIAGLQFALARKGVSNDAPLRRDRGPLPTPRWIIPSILVILLASHAVILRLLTSRMALGLAAAVVVLAMLMHLVPVQQLHRRRRRQ